MKNIKPYSGDPFMFYKDVADRKIRSSSDKDYEQSLNKLTVHIEDAYNLFNKKFAGNDLESLVKTALFQNDSDILEGLYSYRNAPFKNLLKELTTNKYNQIDNICHHCLIGEINSFDHYIPKNKKEFPEFSVHPYNLLPCCTKCNSKKSKNWRLNGLRRTINLYTDNLPNKQYLFVTVTMIDNVPQVDYFIENRNNIDSELYALIESNYLILDLLRRFKESSVDIIDTLHNEISIYLKTLSLEEIIESVHEQIKENRKESGENNRKDVLRYALIVNEEYMKQFKDLITK